MNDPMLDEENPCLRCAKPTIRGLNTEFCSQACEVASLRDVEATRSRVTLDLVRIMIGLDGVLAYQRSHNR
jgi:hypothetical protein